jgi:bifunctional UDP-N-acetylglucosamine pyrophosphorylase/glucosamine-1-phosphate N-acetyltransferase
MIGILLAAGRGTRMKSLKPKVLFPINGEPLCMGPFRALMETCERIVVVVGYRGAEVKEALMAEALGHWDSATLQQKVNFQTQEPPRGTGDAVATAIRGLGKSAHHEKDFIVVNGDLPLIRKQTLERLRKKATDEKLQSLCLSMFASQPKGLGRILRSEMGVFEGIREEKDASPDERKIREVNGGVYFFSGSYLLKNIENLKSKNSQNEFYLTDLLGHQKHGEVRSDALVLRQPWDLMGVNTTYELVAARKLAQSRLQKKWCEEFGVDFLDPATTYVSSKTVFEGDCIVGPGVVFEGRCQISKGTTIDGNAYFKDSTIGQESHILWGSVLDGAIVGANASVGPMAHLRPGSVLEGNVKVGNFVELKKTTMKKGSKASHLSYLGDAEIGEETNIGCGTITCNFDGFSKHKTFIGKNSFIGSDSQLVAPVSVGDNSYVASGTTVTEDIPAGALAIARANMVVKPGYAKKLSEKLAAHKKNS